MMKWVFVGVGIVGVVAVLVYFRVGRHETDVVITKVEPVTVIARKAGPESAISLKKSVETTQEGADLDAKVQEAKTIVGTWMDLWVPSAQDYKQRKENMDEAVEDIKKLAEDAQTAEIMAAMLGELFNHFTYAPAVLNGAVIALGYIRNPVVVEVLEQVLDLKPEALEFSDILPSYSEEEVIAMSEQEKHDKIASVLHITQDIEEKDGTFYVNFGSTKFQAIPSLLSQHTEKANQAVLNYFKTSDPATRHALLPLVLGVWDRDTVERKLAPLFNTEEKEAFRFSMGTREPSSDVTQESEQPLESEGDENE